MRKRENIKTYNFPIAGKRCTDFNDVYTFSKDVKSDVSMWLKTDLQIYKMTAVTGAIGFQPEGTQGFLNISATKAERHEETLRFLKPCYPFVHLRAIVSLWRNRFF